MKYSIIFTGIVALSSDLVTPGKAATLLPNSTTGVVEADNTATRKGPEFPVTTYVKKKGQKSKRKYRFACNGDVPWTKHGKPHCAELGNWKCYRACIKKQLLNSERVDSNKCKKFCKQYYAPDVNQGYCSTSSDDNFGCTIPKIQKEIEEEKKILDAHFNEDRFNDVDEEEQQANEQQAEEEEEKQAEQVMNDWEAAVKQWKKAMKEWRANGSPPGEKPNIGDYVPIRGTKDEKRELEGGLEAQFEAEENQVSAKFLEKRWGKKKFDCYGSIVWKKYGRTHCAAPGTWPCYRGCIRDTVRDYIPLSSGTCKRFCKKHGNPKPGDCTTSSDDGYGCNFTPLLLEGIFEERFQDEMLKPDDEPEKTNSGVNQPHPKEDPESIISWLENAIKKPQPTGT